MSWSEIKKAVNSNINKTLDALITEKANDNKAILNNPTYGLSALKSAMTGGKVPIVKSVQRGTGNTDLKNTVLTVNISNVVSSKSMVILNSGGTDMDIMLTSFTNQSFGVKSTEYNYCQFSWQVIEFY